MTRDEAITITEMVVNMWPDGRTWTAEQIDAYITGIMSLDAELAANAVIAAQKELTRRPTVAEVRGFYRAAQAMAHATAAKPRPYEKPEKLQAWVKRWTAARFLYDRFGRERDMRPFPEQQTQHPLDELMPPGEWADEASQITDADVIKAVSR